MWYQSGDRVGKSSMELAQDELQNFAKTWILVIISLSYCHFIGTITQKGITRLVSILPIIFLFIILPLNLTSVHLLGITSFFISWLSTFKLLLFAAGRGPLVLSEHDHDHAPISLHLFVAVACLPIKIRRGKPDSEHDPSRDSRKQDYPNRRIAKKRMLNFAAKAALLLFMIKMNDYADRLHPKLVWLIYCFHIYFMLELILAAAASTATVFYGVELEPQFNEPLLSTSLQDFWGRRWNLMVTSILRPTVYEPTLVFFRRRVGNEAARVVAVFMTFVVSGAMHELVFYHLGRVKPTLEVTLLFLLHGVCLCVEMAVKRAARGRWRVHRAVSGPVTLVFVLATGFWLFLPPLLRCGAHVRAFEEYAIIGAFFGRVDRSLVSVGR